MDDYKLHLQEFFDDGSAVAENDDFKHEALLLAHQKKAYDGW